MSAPPAYPSGSPDTKSAAVVALPQQPYSNMSAPPPAAPAQPYNDDKEGVHAGGQPYAPPPNAAPPPMGGHTGSGFQQQHAFQQQPSWGSQGPGSNYPYPAPSSNMPTGGSGFGPQYTGRNPPMHPEFTGPTTPPGTYGPGMQQQYTGMYPNQMGQQQQQQWHPGMPQMGPSQPMMPGGPGMMGSGFVTPAVQCQQQGHIVTTRYGAIGLLSAILLFPCGIIVCLLDKTEKCERCHQIFHRGLLD